MTAKKPIVRHQWCRLLLGGASLGAAVAAGAVSTPPAASADDRPPAPTLRISVENGRTSADVGDRLDYTITVENLGTDPVPDLRVTQTMPEGLTLEDADHGGAAREGLVVWAVDVAPGGMRELHTTMVVGSTPVEVLRMASVACASVVVTAAPLVCATHSDELPAGSAARIQDEAASADEAAGPTRDDGDFPVGVVLLGAASVTATLGLALALLRRRRAHLLA